MDNPMKLLEIIIPLMVAVILLFMSTMLLFAHKHLGAGVPTWSAKRRKVTAVVLILIALFNVLTLLW